MTKQLRDDELKMSGGVEIAPVPGHGKPTVDPAPGSPKPTPGGQDEVVADGQQSGGPTELSQLP